MVCHLLSVLLSSETFLSLRGHHPPPIPPPQHTYGASKGRDVPALGPTFKHLQRTPHPKTRSVRSHLEICCEILHWWERQEQGLDLQGALWHVPYLVMSRCFVTCFLPSSQSWVYRHCPLLKSTWGALGGNSPTQSEMVPSLLFQPSLWSFVHSQWRYHFLLTDKEFQDPRKPCVRLPVSQDWNQTGTQALAVNGLERLLSLSVSLSRDRL